MLRISLRLVGLNIYFYDVFFFYYKMSSKKWYMEMEGFFYFGIVIKRPRRIHFTILTMNHRAYIYENYFLFPYILYFGLKYLLVQFFVRLCCFNLTLIYLFFIFIGHYRATILVSLWVKDPVSRMLRFWDFIGIIRLLRFVKYFF